MLIHKDQTSSVVGEDVGEEGEGRGEGGGGRGEGGGGRGRGRGREAIMPQYTTAYHCRNTIHLYDYVFPTSGLFPRSLQHSALAVGNLHCK